MIIGASGGGRRPAQTLAVVFVFAQLPQAINQSKQKIEQPWRGADGKQREENANGVFRAVAK